MSSGEGPALRTRRSPPAIALASPCRSSAPREALQGALSVYARAAAHLAATRRSRRSRRSPRNASAALASAELYQRVALEKERSVAILANIADGIVAVDREGQRRALERARRSGSPAFAPRTRSAARPSRSSSATLASGDDTERGDRLVAIRRADGEDVWLSLTEAVMRDPAGAVAGRIFAFRDISAERVVEQMKSDFVSAVSHELRTPLTSIYGFAETLLRQDVLFGEEERRDVPRLHRLRVRPADHDRRPARSTWRGSTPATSRSISHRPMSGPSCRTVVQTAEQAPAANGHDFVVDLPRASGSRRGRPRQAAADPLEPRRQRDQVLARRRHG